MPVSARDLEELRRLKLAMPEHGGADLSALQSVAEVVAYVATASRAEGGNPANEAELRSGTMARFPRMGCGALRPSSRHWVTPRLANACLRLQANGSSISGR